MKILREELLSKLKRCLPGVDSKAFMLLGADCFVFRNNTVLAYNDCISVTMPLEIGISCAVPASSFYKALSSFKAKEVEIVQEGSKLIITCGRATVEFTTIDEKIYDRFLHILPAEPEWKELPENFNSIIKTGILTHNTSIEGIFVHGKHLIASNQVILIDIELDRPLDRFWINNKAATELVKLPALESYCTNASWIHFKSGDLMFSCRKLIDDNYPEEQFFKLFDSHDAGQATSKGILPKDLVEVLKRASIFSSDDAQEDAKVVYCSIEGKEMTVSASRSIGAFKETLDIEREGEDSVHWVMDVNQFISALSRGKGDPEFYVVKKAHGGAILLKGEGWRQMIGLLKEGK